MAILVSLVALALTTPLTPVPFTEVSIQDSFWGPKQAVNQKVSIPHTLDECEKTGRMNNFDLAAKGARTGFKGLIFDDSDVYKCLEGAAYSLALKKDPALDQRVDSFIARIAAAQMPDGYIDTWYQINAPDKRFTNLRDNHEIYCAGHLIEAGVAHFQATGKRNLFNVAKRCADLLCATFGSQPGKRQGYPGHPEAELALFKMWRATGEQKYFDLAEFFLNTRGTHFYATEHKTPLDQYDGTYWLDDVRLREHTTIKGHAVRAAYLLSGAADLAAAKPDRELIDALDRVWNNTVFKRVFVTGGIGPSAQNEGFTTDYDLPTDSAYQETCASVAMALWNQRMGLLHADAKYWDHVERALYNGFLSGVSLSGDRFFYVNPLASSGNHQRVEWFGCACCPPNVTRTLASVGGYAYAKSSDGLYVHLFIGGSVRTKIGSSTVDLKVETNYPWDGKIVLKPVVDGAPVSLIVRKPTWARSIALHGGGKVVPLQTQNGYVNLGKVGKGTQPITLEMPMPTELVSAHPSAKDVSGKVAVQRGPLIYCFEGHENSQGLDRLFVSPADSWSVQKSKLLGGVQLLKGTARQTSRQSWSKTLYQPVGDAKTVSLTGIPYYAWANRGPSPMTVWLPLGPQQEIPGGLEQTATIRMSFANSNSTPAAIKDGRPIESSSKHPGALCHFWPHKGTEEFVEYSWSTPQHIQSIEVYWFDDTNVGEIRPPAKWWVERWSEGNWVPLTPKGGYTTALDKWNTALFDPFSASKLRLKVVGQAEWSVGMHEVRIIEE